MENTMQIKIKVGPIEIEVCGEQEAAKEQFGLAAEMVKDINNMQLSSTKNVTEDLFGKMLGPLLEDLKK